MFALANCITAIGLLRDREPGAFVIRDSHSFRGAYGLAMKVASPPPSVHQSKKGVCHANKLLQNSVFFF